MEPEVRNADQPQVVARDAVGHGRNERATCPAHFPCFLLLHSLVTIEDHLDVLPRILHIGILPQLGKIAENSPEDQFCAIAPPKPSLILPPTQDIGGFLCPHLITNAKRGVLPRFKRCWWETIQCLGSPSRAPLLGLQSLPPISMRITLLTTVVALSTIFLTPSAEAYSYTRGHYRSNGSYVQPHYRSNSDGYFFNNWSTKGNSNPFTGKKGYRSWKY